MGCIESTARFGPSGASVSCYSFVWVTSKLVPLLFLHFLYTKYEQTKQYRVHSPTTPHRPQKRYRCCRFQTCTHAKNSRFWQIEACVIAANRGGEPCSTLSSQLRVVAPSSAKQTQTEQDSRSRANPDSILGFDDWHDMPPDVAHFLSYAGATMEAELEKSDASQVCCPRPNEV